MAVSGPSGTLWAASRDQVQLFQHISKAAPGLAWKDLEFTVQVKGEPRHILKSVSGQVKPGQCTAILGPSGSGKTSLLNILAGRVVPKPGFEIGGEVLLGGTKVTPSEHQKIFGYVMQEDALFATSTPREIMSFAAKMRLSGHAAAQSLKLADDQLQYLGLSKCADSMVGSAMLKGISGGEKKRTAIGAELITNPEILFLDEPTSGLDSFAAYNVIDILKQLAHKQQVVLCTIHQPSSEILHLFDSIIFLAQGNIVYQGPPSGIRDYFSTIGFHCSADYNPADYVMFLIQTAKQETIDRMVEGWREKGLALASEMPEKEVSLADLQSMGTQSKGFITEFRALCVREVRNLRRDTGSLIARIVVTAVLNLLYSLIFMGAGNVNADDYDVQSHIGAVFNFAIGAMFGAAQPTLLTFPMERPVFLREASCGMYGAPAYFMAKMVVELPLLFVTSAEIWLFGYFFCEFNGNFIVIVLGSFLIASVAASTALIIGSAVPNVKKGMELTPLCFVPQLLFAGFFVKIELIPVVLRWLQYVCFLKWGMNVMLVAEFKDINNCSPAQMETLSQLVVGDEDVGYIGCTHGAIMVLPLYDAPREDQWLNFVILVAICVVFRAVSAVLLSSKAKALYN